VDDEEEEVDYVADKLTSVVSRLRDMSPLYDSPKKASICPRWCGRQKDTKTMAYSNKVIDHYENPRNVGSLPKDDVNVGTGLVGAPECGDVMSCR